MSWTTVLSSWKSIGFRYDGGVYQRTVIKKCYTLLAILAEMEWENVEQLHRVDSFFLYKESYYGESSYEAFLNAPDGTSIIAEVSEESGPTGLLTAVKLEDGWLVTFTKLPDDPNDHSRPSQRKRQHFLRYYLDYARVAGRLSYTRCEHILSVAHEALGHSERYARTLVSGDATSLSKPWKKKGPKGCRFDQVYGNPDPQHVYPVLRGDDAIALRSQD